MASQLALDHSGILRCFFFVYLRFEMHVDQYDTVMVRDNRNGIDDFDGRGIIDAKEVKDCIIPRALPLHLM